MLAFNDYSLATSAEKLGLAVAEKSYRYLYNMKQMGTEQA